MGETRDGGAINNEHSIIAAVNDDVRSIVMDAEGIDIGIQAAAQHIPTSSADQSVTSITTQEFIVVGTAFESVAATSPIDRVGTFLPGKDVIASASLDVVIS